MLVNVKGNSKNQKVNKFYVIISSKTCLSIYVCIDHYLILLRGTIIFLCDVNMFANNAIISHLPRSVCCTTLYVLSPWRCVSVVTLFVEYFQVNSVLTWKWCQNRNASSKEEQLQRSTIQTFRHVLRNMPLTNTNTRYLYNKYYYCLYTISKSL